MSKVFSRPTSVRQYLGRLAVFYACFFLGQYFGLKLGNYIYNRQIAKAVAKAAHPSSAWGSAPTAAPATVAVCGNGQSSNIHPLTGRSLGTNYSPCCSGPCCAWVNSPNAASVHGASCCAHANVSF